MVVLLIPVVSGLVFRGLRFAAPMAMVYFTGVCEIAGVVGLLLSEFRRAAAYALVVFFLAVLPGSFARG